MAISNLPAFSSNGVGLPDPQASAAGGEAAPSESVTPRPVIRGVLSTTPVKTIPSLDTLHVHLAYPHPDVYWYFAYSIEGHEKELRNGVPVQVSGCDVLVKPGANGYKLSVWRGDARAYFTDQTEDNRPGNGMGVYLQLGPGYLSTFGNDWIKAVWAFADLFGIVQGSVKAKVNRFDFALDLLGLPLGQLSADDFLRGWVGRSKKSAFFCERGQLQTVGVGSRGNGIYLRMYDKKAEAMSEGDWPKWVERWDGWQGDVTRVEWEVRPHDAGFGDVELLEGLTADNLHKLANYLADWWRLAQPSSDTNRTRWKDSEFWAQVRAGLYAFADGTGHTLKRASKKIAGLSLQYVRYVVGAVTGAMARCSDRGDKLGAVLRVLADTGAPLRNLKEHARSKAVIYRAAMAEGLG